ncbi:MAG: lysylphosphatidylglycerol synthase domain-containing protein [Minicystis sp.]
MPSPLPSPPAPKLLQRGRVLRVAHGLVALLGVALAILVPARLGFAGVLSAVRPALAVLPLCLGCELLRIGCESVATRLALGRPVPWRPMLFAHLVSYATGAVFPAPRPSAEAVKTTLLGDYVGIPEAASAGATLQAATFFSVGILCTLAGLACRGTSLSLALFVNAGVLITLGILLRGALRSTRVLAFVCRRFPKRAATVQRLHAVAKNGNLLALGPTSCLLLSLFVRVFAQYYISRSMGGAPGLGGALRSEGVRLLAASFGVLVPGQMGIREAFFAYSAEALGTTEAKATAMALFTHLVELSVALVGFTALALRPRKHE